MTTLLFATTALAVTLQNDAHTDGDSATAQGGFAIGECWASVFVPEPEHYPFAPRWLDVAISGGAVETGQVEDFEVWILAAGADGPGAELGSATATLEASNTGLNRVVFADAEGLDIADIEAGDLAVAVCHVDHAGTPSIVNDTDGDSPTWPDRNWIYTGGVWTQSEAFLVRGDWVMRLGIEPREEVEGDTGTGESERGCGHVPPVAAWWLALGLVACRRS